LTPTLRRLLLAPAALAAAAGLPGPAAAERIANPVAVFTGLDKITGRIITFDVYTDETVQFGALRVTPRVCYSRPPTEAARTDAFVEVDEITLDNQVKRIFTGWMFAASPGLNAVEHPVYDVWLNDCREDSDVPRPGEGGEARTAAARAETPESEGALGVETIDGVPIPRPKPVLPGETAPAAAPEEPLPGAEEFPPGEILD
jgi:hypothetical protein